MTDPVVRVEIERVGRTSTSEFLRWRAKAADGSTVDVSETVYLAVDAGDRRKLIEWVGRLFPNAVLAFPRR